MSGRATTLLFAAEPHMLLTGGNLWLKPVRPQGSSGRAPDTGFGVEDEFSGEQWQRRIPSRKSTLSSLYFALVQICVKPAAMNDAMRALTAAKSSDLHSPPDNLSMRPVRASVVISAPVTK